MQRTLGSQISHALKTRDVEVIFGIPGVHNVEMYRGIEEAGITHVLARHEQGAGFMADGYARATGKPGVAYVITGPGLCNIMTPMGQAYSDSVPMLVISSCLDDTVGKRGQLHQMLDQRAAADCVCDWSIEAATPQEAYELLSRAWHEFAHERGRSKHIQVPIAALEAMADPAPDPNVATDQVLDAQIPDDLIGALNAAKRPLFVFGGGASEAAKDARALLEKTKAGAFTTYAGRGIVPPDYPYLFGSYLARPSSADVIASADVVVVVGSELSECDLWRDQLGQTCPMYRIDIEDIDLPAVDDEIRIKGDARHLLGGLAHEVAGKAVSGWSQTHVQECRAKWRNETDAERPGIVPIAQAMQDALPTDTMFFSDMTQFAYVAKEVLDMPNPGLWHHPFGFGTLGYALPAAIGGKVGRGDAPVVAILGDYGLHYTLPEIGVAVELGLSLPILVWDNSKLMEIEDAMVRSQIAPNAVVAKNPNFCAVAEAFGAAAVKPETLSEMADALNAALSAGRPTLIHVSPDILG